MEGMRVSVGEVVFMFLFAYVMKGFTHRETIVCRFLAFLGDPFVDTCLSRGKLSITTTASRQTFIDRCCTEIFGTTSH